MESDFPDHVEEAARKLSITDRSTFDTDPDDTPSCTQLFDIGRAKVYLLGLHATAQDQERWDHLIALTETLQAVQPDPIGVAVVARAVLQGTRKPDSLDTLIMLQGLTNLPEDSRLAIEEAGLAVFSILHPRDTAPLLEALRTHVEPSEVGAFCRGLTQYALIRNARSRQATVRLHKLDDYMEQARRTLQTVSDEHPTQRPLDNLDAIRNLIRLGPQGRAAAFDAGNVLQPFMRGHQLPLALTHLFVQTVSHAARWTHAADDVRRTLLDSENLYVDIRRLDEASWNNFVLTLFQAGIPREPIDSPPPYCEEEREEARSSTDPMGPSPDYDEGWPV